jgi:hypothetical protein
MGQWLVDKDVYVWIKSWGLFFMKDTEIYERFSVIPVRNGFEMGFS